MARALCLVAVLTFSQAGKPSPAPLTEEQRTRISRLANDTQKDATRLKELLQQRQKELARVYGEYELDEKRATALEAEILDLQRQMLTNYRKMQVELRTLIGKERFTILKQRLDNFLDPPARKSPEKDKKTPKRP